MTDKQRHEYVQNRYKKLYLIVAKRIHCFINRHRVREIQKYLDFSVPHLDLIQLTKPIELHPEQ